MTLQERQVAIEEFRQSAMLELAQGYEWKICVERWLARWATLFDPPLHYPMPELPARNTAE